MGTVVNTTSANLKKYKEETIKKIANLVQDIATEVEIAATRGAPAFVTIDKKITEKGLQAEVGVMGGGLVDIKDSTGNVVGRVYKDGNPIAAYFEFGTGLSAKKILAKYPDWIKKIARQFYINGKGTLTGKPYLFNNFLLKKKDFERELKKIVNEFHNDN